MLMKKMITMMMMMTRRRRSEGLIGCALEGKEERRRGARATEILLHRYVFCVCVCVCVGFLFVPRNGFNL